VHGPLLALGAIEAARRLSAEAITALSYRLVSPAYPGTPIEFSAREAPATTVGGTQNGKPKIEASVTR
jgi:hydroxyacyl-ACP dehydratase HTD2-like protein with hotdog domain